jgi:hypothetical protein
MDVGVEIEDIAHTLRSGGLNLGDDLSLLDVFLLQGIRVCDRG